MLRFYKNINTPYEFIFMVRVAIELKLLSYGNLKLLLKLRNFIKFGFKKIPIVG
jgi:hypothetical protein